ncbi:hypothetical protein FBY35_0415 [Streptomyces sp. SLBN-118]|nr:hypothetical protein FBY35_0415 [Streptomyces sp. SLBN-118]
MLLLRVVPSARRRSRAADRFEDHVERLVAELGREFLAQQELVMAELGGVLGPDVIADHADDQVGPGRSGELGGERAD